MLRHASSIVHARPILYQCFLGGKRRYLSSINGLVHASQPDGHALTEENRDNLRNASSSAPVSDFQSERARRWVNTEEHVYISSSSIIKHATSSRRRYGYPSLRRFYSTDTQPQSQAQPENKETESRSETISRKLNFSAVEQEAFDELLKEVQEPMTNAKPGEIRSLEQNWRKGEPVNTHVRPRRFSDSGSKFSERKDYESRSKEAKSRSSESQRLRDTRASYGSSSTFSDRLRSHTYLPRNIDAKFLLPVYRLNDEKRLARIRRNDVRNLSYLEAETKLGMATELYNSTFASGKKRGGRNGERRKKSAVEKFERETGVEVKGTHSAVRSEANGHGMAQEEGGTGLKESSEERDSFLNIWGDLASTARRKQEQNVPTN